jgi:small conductance mechanosensitive channel
MDTTLDINQVTAFSDVAWAWLVSALPRIALAAIALGVGFYLAKWAARLATRIAQRTSHGDETVSPVLGAVVGYAIRILAIVWALGQLGVQTASLLAILGAAGLAIGLALQGTLTNIAAGIMLLWLRPFRVGDYIEVNGIAGTVRQISLFVCHLETFDGIFIFAPNASIWNFALRNHSRTGLRLVSVTVNVPPDGDTARMRQALIDLAAEEPRILRDPPPSVFVDGIVAGATVLNFRAWTRHADLGELQRRLIEGACRRAGDAAGAAQQIVRIVPPDSDPSRLVLAGAPRQAQGRR